MSGVLLFLVCVIGMSTVHGMENQSVSVKCEEPIYHYLELGCRPVYSESNGSCPERYECPFMERTLDPKKCYYKSQQYRIRQAAGEEVGVEHLCSARCVCRRGFKGRAVVTCAHIECPEDFNPPESTEERCVNQYRLSDCCSYREICGTAAINELKTCEWEGIMYKEGERIYPTGTCEHCICSKKFDGTAKSLECSKINCGIEIHNANKAIDKCAPVYLESSSCCPIQWKCPSRNDEIVKTAVHKSSSMLMRCHHGDTTLSIGDSIMTGNDCITCTCSVPPLVTCIRSRKC